jgi:uncharacterized protein YdhG (YjbR/CyaY superfamily)
MKKAVTIDAYIKMYPKSVQTLLRQMRTVIQKSAPKAEEAVKYGIPTFVQSGNLVHFGGFKSHIGFFPGASGISAFKKELSTYKTSKGTVQFPLDTPLPVGLISKIVKYRVKENVAKKK